VVAGGGKLRPYREADARITLLRGATFSSFVTSGRPWATQEEQEEDERQRLALEAEAVVLAELRRVADEGHVDDCEEEEEEGDGAGEVARAQAAAGGARAVDEGERQEDDDRPGDVRRAEVAG